eukprot:CAMPEP_0168486296 /NCGR_PEP_ID=MMETSP0228-20121227/67048_2 /TAXON_ID=133427 /ORGANISM="Protoceratium reticulatum, Strain CCCM 535 (=CCMP 1889)" /LENGTH=46 /DNA_ID= /DNA_START= /DNA_END= /DNA_ORIENTATION=
MEKTPKVVKTSPISTGSPAMPPFSAGVMISNDASSCNVMLMSESMQ